MERTGISPNILDLYQAPASERYPVVCFDEKPVQLISERKEPIPGEPGQPERYDYEYVREGTRNLFVFFDPNAGWRHMNVTQRRTGYDFAEQMRLLVEEYCPKAHRIRLMLVNLSTHKFHWLYDLLDARRARNIAADPKGFSSSEMMPSRWLKTLRVFA